MIDNYKHTVVEDLESDGRAGVRVGVRTGGTVEVRVRVGVGVSA